MCVPTVMCSLSTLNYNGALNDKRAITVVIETLFPESQISPPPPPHHQYHHHGYRRVLCAVRYLKPLPMNSKTFLVLPSSFRLFCCHFSFVRKLKFKYGRRAPLIPPKPNISHAAGILVPLLRSFNSASVSGVKVRLSNLAKSVEMRLAVSATDYQMTFIRMLTFLSSTLFVSLHFLNSSH